MNKCTMPCKRPMNAKRLCALTLPLLAALLQGCAHNCSNCAASLPQQTLHIPPAPPLREALPAQSYSQSAQTDINNWLQRLTDTPAMP